MHKAILSRLQREAAPLKLSRFASGRGPILAVFDDWSGHPLWVAKTASEPLHAARLRNEYDALMYIAPWSGELGIPRVLEWQESCGEAVLIQSGVPGARGRVSLSTNASDKRLERHFQEPLAWAERFRALVPAPSGMTVGQLAERYVVDLRGREFGNAVNGLVEILGQAGPASLRPVVAVHGDFNPSNVLLKRPGLSVVDWPTFGPGFPLQDAFSFITNTDYYGRGHVCALAESYQHAFFSSSRVSQLVRLQTEAAKCSADDSRFLFYCFLAAQICADAAVPQQTWLDILGYLQEFGYPGPFTPLPAPRLDSGSVVSHAIAASSAHCRTADA
jgi:hypothetical protein